VCHRCLSAISQNYVSNLTGSLFGVKKFVLIILAVVCIICARVLAVVLFELCCVNVTLYSFPVVTDHIAVRPVLISVGLTYFLLAHFTTMHACVCVVGLCVGHADAEQVIRLQDTSSECRRCRVG